MEETTRILDGGGVYGLALHYSLILFFVGGAFLIFLYLWKKGRLDLDEQPKYQMMELDEEDIERKKTGEGNDRRAK